MHRLLEENDQLAALTYNRHLREKESVLSYIDIYTDDCISEVAGETDHDFTSLHYQARYLDESYKEWNLNT